jgi:hypothetical protein
MCILPLSAAYQLYFTKVQYPVIQIVLFFVLLIIPASLPRLKLLLRVSTFVLLPCRVGLELYLQPASVLPALALIPPCICIPSLGTLLHGSVAEQLSIAFFVNAIVFSCAHTQLECTVSALATGMTTTFILIKHVWLRRTEVAPPVLDDKAWRVAAPIAVPIVAAEFCIGVSNAYPGAIWHFVSEFEDVLFTAAAGVALLGSLLCLWNCQQQATNCQSEDASQLHDFHERIAASVRLAGLCIAPMNAAYQLHFANVIYPLIHIVMFIVMFLVLLMTSAALPRLKLLLKVMCFAVLPCRMTLELYLHPGSIIPPLALIPPSIAIPTGGALLHASVAEQLSVALFVNAVVLYCARDPAVCAVSVGMTALSSVAVVVKNATLRASFEASRAKAETTLRRECEIEGAHDCSLCS